MLKILIEIIIESIKSYRNKCWIPTKILKNLEKDIKNDSDLILGLFCENFPFFGIMVLS